MSPCVIATRRVDTPLGEMILGVFGGRLCLLDHAKRKDRRRVEGRLRRLLGAEMAEAGDDSVPLLDEAQEQLEDYLAGRRKAFDLPLLMAGTEFQKRVWRALLDIPRGSTMTYGALARAVGRPAAARAVAAANAANAMSVVIPCHRVVAAGGLGGYAGGARAKRLLLRLEGACPPGAEW